MGARPRNPVCRRVIGGGSAISTFLALGLTLLAPDANADPIDDAIEAIVDSLVGDAGSAAALPGAGDDFVWDAFSQLYDSIHTTGEQWISSDIGQQVDNAINAPFVELFGRDLIGNGVQGAVENVSLLGSSGIFGSLHDGGFLFGDGGSGMAGNPEHGCSPIFCGLFATDGGDAGLIGNGGVGGSIDSDDADSPGDEYVAATGFNGGNGGILMGNGGAGGQGGDGLGGSADAAVLVGGTGGNGGNGGFLFGDGGTGGDGGDGAVGLGGAVGDGGPGGAGGRAALIVGNGGNGGDGGDGRVGGAGGPGGSGGLFGTKGLSGATGEGGAGQSP